MIFYSTNQLSAGKFKMLILIFMLSTRWLLAGSIIMPENKYLKDAQLNPTKLRLQGDSIRFTVKGTIPVESVFFPKNPKVSLSLKAEENILDFGEVTLTKNLKGYEYEKKYTLRFEPWMAEASLEVSFLEGKKDAQDLVEKKTLAKGVIAPQLMVKLGEVYPDEPIPVVGLYMPSAAGDRDLLRKEEFSLIFESGSSTYRPTTANLETLRKIDSFLESNPQIYELKITGIQSPEAGEGKNSALGMNRAESAKKALGTRIINLQESQLKTTSRRNDWFDLRLLLKEYKGISTNRMEELYAILMNQETYLEQTERLKKVPGFSQVAQDLYPKLRIAKIEISARPLSGLDMRQSVKLKEALSSKEGKNELTLEEWTLAAESTQSFDEKATIYAKMTEFFRSPLPYNNMAVVRMRQAQRTLDQQSKEILWAEAMRLLTQAYRVEANPYTLHNQGQILVLTGNYWEAYLKLSQASSLTQNPDFVQHNEALKGALDILRGDYKLATLRFEYNFTDPKDYFNKGIAFFMIEDYASATIAFEESVVQGRAFGYGFYGLAMIAAGSGQKEIALIHLKKAIAANRQLAERAFNDPLFEELRESEGFFRDVTSN